MKTYTTLVSLGTLSTSAIGVASTTVWRPKPQFYMDLAPSECLSSGHNY